MIDGSDPSRPGQNPATATSTEAAARPDATAPPVADGIAVDRAAVDRAAVDRAAVDRTVAEEIAALRREGKLGEAASLARRHGHGVLAAELFATIWRWPEAIAAAEEAGRLDEAYRWALTGSQGAAAERLLGQLAAPGEQALAAAVHARAHGRHLHEARLRAATGDMAAATEAFVAAGAFFEAARLLEAEGRDRDAGRLLERHLQDHPGDRRASFLLGQILARFARYEPAARALQRAASLPVPGEAAKDAGEANGDDPIRAPALRLLVACFAALGMDEAARIALGDLVAEAGSDIDGVGADDVPAFLVRTFGDVRGLLAPSRADAAGTAPDRAGDLLLGRYRVLRPLGAGATGRVVLARDVFFDRDVAIKVLTVAGGPSGRDAYQRFAREARIAGSLDHPNLVRMYDYHPAGPLLVMEHMVGGTLEDRLDPKRLEPVGVGVRPETPAGDGGSGLGQARDGGRGPMPLDAVRHTILALLDGLEAMHRCGVVHRDLKPANIFFGPAHEVKIGDFGVSHLADLGATLTGAMVGTLAYMAPEQITGARQPLAATDLYALGVILFRCLTGCLPFAGPDFVGQHLGEPPPLVSAAAPWLDPRFDALVACLLMKDPAERPQGVAAVRAMVSALSWHDAAPRDGAVEGSGAGSEGAAPTRVSIPSSTEQRPTSAQAATPRVAPSAPGHRYRFLRRLPDSMALIHDTLLDRPLRQVAIDGAAAERLRAAARADMPFLQAIYALDRRDSASPDPGALPGGESRGAAGLAWVVQLEHPRGDPLAADGLRADRRRGVREQLGLALAALHQEGLVHGAVDPEHVLVGEGRAVLLLAWAPAEGGTAADDRRALERLFPDSD